MKTKNLIRIMVFAIMVFTVVIPIKVEAAISGIFVDEVRLSEPNKFFCGGIATATGPLDGVTCTAELDTTTGTLTLYNYSGISINMPYTGQGDLTIVLKGNNTITGGSAIYNNSGSDIIITSNTNGSLVISSIGAGNMRGILSQNIGVGFGSIIISGNANIEIYAETTGTGTAFALDGESISFLDDVSVTTVSKSAGTNPNSTIGMNASGGDITINTTGNISIDSSGHTNDSSSVSGKANFNIINVGQMTLKYSGDGHGGEASDTPPLFDPDHFSVIATAGSETYVPILKFLDDAGYDIPDSEVGTPITPVDVFAGVSDGYGTYEFTATGLPKGLNIDTLTGVISGTPTKAQDSGTAIITVNDDATSKTITINYGKIIDLSNPLDDNTKDNNDTNFTKEKNPETSDINIVPIIINFTLSLIGIIYITIILKKQYFVHN